MKADIKCEILQAARALFRERGYLEVTMRDVAEKLGISVGNLTYHFKKKEDLIEAVVLERHKAHKPFAQVQTIAELDALFWRLTEHQSSNQYYFRNYAQLAQMCPRVAQIQLSIMREIYAAYDIAFQNLRKAGLMQPELFAGQTRGMIQVLMTASCYAIAHFARWEDMPYDPRASLWAVALPALTERGRKIFEREVAPLGNNA